MSVKIDPRFNPLNESAKMHLFGHRSLTPEERIAKARLIASERHAKVLQEAEEAEMERINNMCINRLSQSDYAEKKRRKEKRASLQEAEHKAIAAKISDILLEAVPFDMDAKAKFGDGIKEHAQGFIMSLFEHNVLTDLQFTKNPSKNIKKIVLSVFDEDAYLSEEADDLSKDIADAIRMKAQELIKQEIANAKVNDDTEDNIHDTKEDLGGVEKQNTAPNADGTQTDPNAQTDTNTNVQTPADNSGAPAPAKQDGNTNAPADANAQQPETNENPNDAFGIGEDYLELRPNMFHVGKSRFRPAFKDKLFGKLLTESHKELVRQSGNSDPEKALGNATALYCLYECLDAFNLINEDNADIIVNQMVKA